MNSSTTIRACTAILVLSANLLLPVAAFAGQGTDPNCRPGVPCPLPEPETLVLFAVGAAGLALSRFRKK